MKKLAKFLRLTQIWQLFEASAESLTLIASQPHEPFSEILMLEIDKIPLPSTLEVTIRGSFGSSSPLNVQ